MPSANEAAATVCRSAEGWHGLWVARIEHFEKVQFTGLKVRPHYDLTSDGSIVSHVHFAWGPLAGWLSASGKMTPDENGAAEVKLVFDDFWVGGDNAAPRTSPAGEVSAFDQFTRSIGRTAFFEGLAGFPVNYVDMERGLVAFRFPPLDSQIVAQRCPEGEEPKRAQ